MACPVNGQVAKAERATRQLASHHLHWTRKYKEIFVSALFIGYSMWIDFLHDQFQNWFRATGLSQGVWTGLISCLFCWMGGGSLYVSLFVCVCYLVQSVSCQVCQAWFLYWYKVNLPYNDVTKEKEVFCWELAAVFVWLSAVCVCCVRVHVCARARTRLRQHPVLYLKDMYRTHIVSKIIFELFTINFNRQLLEESVGYQ